MNLEIPETDREALSAWLFEDKRPVEPLLVSLQGARPTLRVSELAEQIEGSIDSEHHAALPEILYALMSLSLTVTRLIRDGVHDWESIVFRAIAGKYVADAERRARVIDRLRRVLNTTAIEITAKAIGVTDSQHWYCTARTYTQIRPVFKENPLSAAAAVILHELKLIYHSGPEGARSEVFIAMDNEDLIKLRSIIQRALDKEASLRDELTKTGGIQILS